jgi:hypothetical protein
MQLAVIGRYLSATALMLALSSPAAAVWDEEFSKWRKQPLLFQHGYLVGVLEGVLQIQFAGDSSEPRDKIRDCIPFASTETLLKAMDQTVVMDPSYANKPIVPVLMETLGRICLRTKE